MLDPQGLIELSQELVNSRQVGAPKQVVLRRAVSTAYYAVFHELCGSITETFVSANARESRALFYRSLDHTSTKRRCEEIGKNPLRDKEKNFFGIASFPQGIRDFTNAFIQLQKLRHRADYDPDYKLTKAQAQQCIDDATDAIAQLQAADDAVRNKFLAYILFDIRA